MSQTLLVKKSDFSDVSLVHADDPPLADGDIRVAIGPWALTANNITYMVAGDRIGYWKFFDPQAYGLDKPDHGRMPVWGYARVTQSRCEGVEPGQTLYGFLPIADHFDMRPTKISRSGFVDGNEHRTGLHNIYNRYTVVESDPSFAVHQDLQPLLRPLFTTSFLIDDFLDDENVFGADQVLILSASSKTALGTAFCLKERGGVKITGLTSDGNMAFTRGTGFYDAVYNYDSVTSLDPQVKTVIVDMSGNGTVIAAVQDHFKDNLKYICRVGLSHWDSLSGVTSNQTTSQAFFFAPDRAKQRLEDWGGAGFATQLGARWLPFLDSASDWLSIEKTSGIGPILQAYKAVLGGQAAPDKGYLFSL